MSITYTAGTVAAVADLVVGDTIYLHEREHSVGLSEPTHPVTIKQIEPTGGGTSLIAVVSANAGSSVAPRLLGYLAVTREFRRAMAVSDDPQEETGS